MFLVTKSTPRLREEDLEDESEEREGPAPRVTSTPGDYTSSSDGGFNDPDITGSTNDDDDALAYLQNLLRSEI